MLFTISRALTVGRSAALFTVMPLTAVTSGQLRSPTGSANHRVTGRDGRQITDQLPTQGDHSQFPPAKLAEVLAGVGAAIDATGCSFTLRYTTVAVTAARIGAA